MARTKLSVVGPDGRRPFMRGILVQSLVSRGVPFDVALSTATRVREELVESGEVRVEDILKHAERVLPEPYDLDTSPARIIEEPPRVRTGAATAPFSKGILAVSLEGAGLDREDAYIVAMEVETQLLREVRSEIDRGELRELVEEIIERTHGSIAANRYRVWRAAISDGRPLLLLIGGATGTGKTSIAVEVARRLEVAHVIGTDSIRQIMRLMFSNDLMPEIYGSSYDTGLGLPVDAAQPRAVGGFLMQAQKIAVGVHALLDRALEENTSLVVEGASLVPGLVDLDRYRQDAHVIFLVVATLDLDAYQSRFKTRASAAKDRGADRYVKHLNEIQEIQDYILAEADHQGLPIIDNVHFDDAVLSVIRSVIATLNKSGVRAVEDDGPKQKSQE